MTIMICQQEYRDFQRIIVFSIHFGQNETKRTPCKSAVIKINVYEKLHLTQNHNLNSLHFLRIGKNLKILHHNNQLD